MESYVRSYWYMLSYRYIGYLSILFNYVIEIEDTNYNYI